MKFIAIFVLVALEIVGSAAQGEMIIGNSSSATIERYVEEVREHFTIRGQPIHPFVFRDLGGSISDNRPVITAVDVLSGVDSNYYSSGSVEKTAQGFGAADGDEQSYYDYSFLGRLENGLLVVQANSSGGGSGVFRSLYFLDVIVDTAFSSDGEPYERVNLKVTRKLSLGDRWDGSITIDGSKVIVRGKSMAHMAGPITTRVVPVQRPEKCRDSLE